MLKNRKKVMTPGIQDREAPGGHPKEVFLKNKGEIEIKVTIGRND